MEHFYPFSVLDTRTKKWKDNDRMWIDKCNIKSELGREDTKSKSGFWETPDYTSIFSPTLSQLMYKWFCPPKGRVLDCFAGGSVRGIVAEELGFKYTGIDISEKQIEANKLQSDKPNWIAGDSIETVRELNEEYDFIFTCPPYHDLEVYSDNPNDISTKSYEDFMFSLEYIMYLSSKKLKDNRFIGMVVSEIRDLGTTRNYKIGKYKGFVSDVIKMMEKHDLYFYNDMVLFNSQHQASRTLGTYFKRNRKTASVHQNVLVFVKGNPDLATEVIEWDGNYVCTVDGVEYRSYREASISINHDELGVSEVVRRCKSRKSKYKDWQTIGDSTTPNIKYIIDGIPFESVLQINEKTGITENEIYNKILSNNPINRNWYKYETDIYENITYAEMDDIQERAVIQTKAPTISCDGKLFFSTYEAGTHFGLSKERIRQKLKDSKHPTYFYLF